jgi:hypothetical protein
MVAATVATPSTHAHLGTGAGTRPAGAASYAQGGSFRSRRLASHARQPPRKASDEAKLNNWAEKKVGKELSLPSVQDLSVFSVNR